MDKDTAKLCFDFYKNEKIEFMRRELINGLYTYLLINHRIRYIGYYIKSYELTNDRFIVHVLDNEKQFSFAISKEVYYIIVYTSEKIKTSYNSILINLLFDKNLLRYWIYLNNLKDQHIVLLCYIFDCIKNEQCFMISILKNKTDNLHFESLPNFVKFYLKRIDNRIYYARSQLKNIGDRNSILNWENMIFGTLIIGITYFIFQRNKLFS